MIMKTYKADKAGKGIEITLTIPQDFLKDRQRFKTFLDLCYRLSTVPNVARNLKWKEGKHAVRRDT